MSGKGTLYVNSKISRPDILDEATFLRWYEEDHIAEIMQSSGIHTARRFVDINPKADKPYLAIYAMNDIGFTQTDEFRNIRVKSKILPPPGLIYDLAEFDVRYDNLVHVYDKAEKSEGATKSLVVATVELDKGVSAEGFDIWYRNEYWPLIAENNGFLRTIRLKLVYARTNAQSRVLKGLAPATDEPAPQPATSLSLHEFECEPEEIDLSKFERITTTLMEEKMMASFRVCETRVYKLMKEFGGNGWFQGVGM
ncbi:hypothetical protein BDV59DRAFT_202710 [Aspergillus ambiguus]|uniref:uncharacterized protein n=1 Tax=Aspergillus ambiguus TaxID=176160 RepID=UPI003CCD9EA6